MTKHNKKPVAVSNHEGASPMFKKQTKYDNALRILNFKGSLEVLVNTRVGQLKKLAVAASLGFVASAASLP